MKQSLQPIIAGLGFTIAALWMLGYTFSADTNAEPPFGFTWFALAIYAAVVLFFLPTVIADERAHPNLVSIALLNVLLGWTFFGWVVALVWSTTNTERRSPA